MKRFTLTIDDESDTVLTNLAEKLNKSKAEVLRQGLALVAYIEKQKEKGGQIILEEENGDQKIIAAPDLPV